MAAESCCCKIAMSNSPDLAVTTWCICFSFLDGKNLKFWNESRQAWQNVLTTFSIASNSATFCFNFCPPEGPVVIFSTIFVQVAFWTVSRYVGSKKICVGMVAWWLSGSIYPLGSYQPEFDSFTSFVLKYEPFLYLVIVRLGNFLLETQTWYDMV